MEEVPSQEPQPIPIRDLPKVPEALRTEGEVQRDYNMACAKYGDAMLKKDETDRYVEKARKEALDAALSLSKEMSQILEARKLQGKDASNANQSTQ